MTGQGKESCIVRDLIAARAEERPDAPAILFTDGPEWSFADLRARVRERAACLFALGVRQGDFVLSWLPNGPHAVLNFLALNELGAVYVPLNTAWRGEVLRHGVENSGAALMIAHGALIERLADLSFAQLERIVVVGPERPALPGLTLLSEDTLSAPTGAEASEPREPPRPLSPRDTHMVIYTSGTTGPSKGVLASYRHSHAAALGFRNIGPGDCVYTALPMHHVGGVYAVLWALIHGGPAVMADSFRTAEFWETVRRYRVTTTGLLGAMARFLLARPPAPDDRGHTLRSVLIAPYDEAAAEFAARFGVDVYTEFNMTELSVPLFTGPAPGGPGLCGRLQPGWAARLVDAQGADIAEGAAGELILRPADPWTISHGYHNNPEATARTWRDGWFHTGDLFRRDADGLYYFVDRAKDALRRRGENISSFEVESAILLHPAVREAAVVAAPGAEGEDEVLAVLALKDGAALDPAALLEFLRPRLAHFMLPRYVRVMDALPKTPTHKVEKHVLRAAGVTPDTWDREPAGLRVRRDRLERR